MQRQQRIPEKRILCDVPTQRIPAIPYLIRPPVLVLPIYHNMIGGDKAGLPVVRVRADHEDDDANNIIKKNQHPAAHRRPGERFFGLEKGGRLLLLCNGPGRERAGAPLALKGRQFFLQRRTHVLVVLLWHVTAGGEGTGW